MVHDLCATQQLRRLFIYPLVRLVSWTSLQVAGSAGPHSPDSPDSPNRPSSRVMDLYRIAFPLTRWIPLSRSGRGIINSAVIIMSHIGYTLCALCALLVIAVSLSVILVLSTNALSGLSVVHASKVSMHMVELRTIAAGKPIDSSMWTGSRDLYRNSRGLVSPRFPTTSAPIQTSGPWPVMVADPGRAIRLGIDMFGIGTILTGLGILGLRVRAH